jgi:restriction system protein
MAGPKYAKYFTLVLSALKELGNSGTPSEVSKIIAEKENISDDALDKRLKNRTSYFENQVAWAKYYLAKAGLVDTSRRGVWSLTEKGIQVNITEKDAVRLWQEINQQLKSHATVAADIPETALEEEIAPSDVSETTVTDYKQELLEIIRNLPPAGFEHLCKRLLRESGFDEVEVTGRTGDNGIDGKGILRINPFLSMKVLFQSKRYGANSPVTASHVRDFRGAMSGRTDKGILITTSFFTIDAQREASREGVEQIELVDGEKLVAMFEQLQLGLKSKAGYEVDAKFFEEFKRR